MHSSFPHKKISTFNKPVLFDILSPDKNTSLIPDGMKMLLQVNPSQMKISHQKIIERITTRGGFVEQHFGERPVGLTFEGVTGGFVHRKYGYIANTVNSSNNFNDSATRRDTLAYSKYLDLLAFYKNNGAIYNKDGLIIVQGIIRVEFDNHTWDGWFSSFNVTEASEKPYMFTLSCEMTIDSSSIKAKPF
jgi:hypothetical protein